MYYMLLQKGKKKGTVTVGAGTSGQAAACGRVASACGGSGSAGGVSGSVAGRGNGATVTGSAAGGNGVSSSGGGASRKAKVVVCQQLKKPWKELQPRSRKNISDEYVFIIKQLCWYGIYYKKKLVHNVFS